MADLLADTNNKSSVNDMFFAVNRKRWMVCVDGSKSGEKAFNTAFFDLVNPIRHDTLVVAVVDSGGVCQGQALLDNKEKQLKANQTILKSGLQYELLLIPGVGDDKKHVAQAICKAVTDNKINFVAIGSRGLSGIKKQLLGSVSSHVATHCEVPVMIVR
eukprot:TRINITY_DN7944_c0_g1_i1.p2 TRINITY_DN7944_c0_g1~~TRINITY_DN7944_c0_g1_i1.p2  ORF type:complete len:159 (+),score=48.99 TRINITY_DN7944_c0_g1_i1:159-635(+)